MADTGGQRGNGTFRGYSGRICGDTGEGGLRPLRFGGLSKFEFVDHCFTTKAGGVSKGCCSSFNISIKRDPDKQAPLENLRRLAEYMGADYNKLTRVSQAHGDNVLVVTRENCGAHTEESGAEIKADAMITDVPGILLVTSHGDCLPVYLVDPVKKAVGMVHSGWRGTALGIAGAAVRKMQETYGSRPQDIFAEIGPGIMQECFSTDIDVASAMEENFGVIRDDKYIYYSENEQKYHVSLPDYAALSLTMAGVKKENIEMCGICTCCEKNSDLFFSHRRQRGQCGIMGAAIMIR